MIWSYWPVLASMASKWWKDPQFSHAVFVPLFSGFLVWRWWDRSVFDNSRPCSWGLIPLVFGGALRIVGTWYYVDFLEAVSVLPVMAGAVILVCGWPVFRLIWPALGFLAFMIPLPFRLETGLSLPLQRLATLGSTYVLQTLGSPAFAEGNVIVINDSRIGIVEACNGLGMFLMFVAVSAGVALLVQRPLWERAFLLLSAIPIAVAVNIIRIVVTTLIHEWFGSERVDAIAHDVAGWIMMPLAIAFLMVELKFLSRAFVCVEATPRVAFPTERSSKTARGASKAASR